jgi:hypothetical protein
MMKCVKDISWKIKNKICLVKTKFA